MGNVYMEADQVRFKNSTYRNIQEGLAAALEGGGGGGTTVVANPEGSATADLAKLQVGTTIYGIPAEAGDISYDNTSSGLTADDVQEAIDELNTGLSGVTELIPSGATTSNKLATASDIPDAVTGNPSGSATAGNLTKLQIGDDIYNVPSGGGGFTWERVDIDLSTVNWNGSGTGWYSDLLLTNKHPKIAQFTGGLTAIFSAGHNIALNIAYSSEVPFNGIMLIADAELNSGTLSLLIGY